MDENQTLGVIRNNLFYGSTDYTKSQPDLFTPHKFKMIAPSRTDAFLETVKDSLADEEEILLYVHLPFCFSECLFCNSFPYKADREAQNNYLQSLLKEIELTSKQSLFKGRKARCIYFGGGTPTSFPTSDLGLILESISSHIDLSETCNVTTEAHPVTLPDKKSIREFAAIGINRISCGCQTFDPEILLRCNRQNTPEQMKRIVRDVQDAGMTINIDMMTGLPGQTLESVGADLRILGEIRPDAVEYIRHEIVNPLIIKIYQEDPGLIVSNDDLFEMVRITQEWMAQNGYEQNGRFTNDRQWPYRYYWLDEMPIIAFGMHARSYTKTICYDKHEELTTYTNMINRGLVPVGRSISLDIREQMYRSLLLNLQLKRGLDIARFRARYKLDPLEVFAPLYAKLSEYGCLRHEDGAISLTKVGAYFVEDVCDYIIDAVLREESDLLVRTPHSTSSSSQKLN
jgi:oxygen-independent coproporphyrinogen III oxidase